VLVTGESGTGKSTLKRALAGAWPWGKGDIDVRAGAKLSVVPQRPYVPMGTLRRAVTYPDAAESRSAEEIASVLKKVGLGRLAGRLDKDRLWDQVLSGGEKQRVAFARILLHRPDIIVLDEATAALDGVSQDRVMELLSRELKDATVVSIGHRAELADFHDRKIILRRGESGAGLVGDAHPLRSPDAPDCFAALQGSCASATTGLYQLLVPDVGHSVKTHAASVIRFISTLPAPALPSPNRMLSRTAGGILPSASMAAARRVKS
jgi:energy-coupling factor transporter ATP-binding protein EcfA2